MLDRIRSYQTFIVAYSGGKDSTAMLLWALDNLPQERIRVVFCDTGAEWPETYDYLDYVDGVLPVDVERIHSGDPVLERADVSGRRKSPFRSCRSLYEMIQTRGMWPGARFRWCTGYLKRWPLTLYARGCEDPVLLFGQRREESERRARMDPFVEKHEKSGFPIYRPVLEWTEGEVWRFVDSFGLERNPVYEYAAHVSCWCCIMARPAEVVTFCRLHPGIAQVWVDLEEAIGHDWTKYYRLGDLLRRARLQPRLVGL